MHFTHSTSNKANPTQRHRTLTTISFFSFSCYFFLRFFKKNNPVCPYTSSCNLAIPHLAQCTTSHDPWVKLSLGFKCHEHFHMAATWDSVLAKEGNSPVNSGVFDRCKRSLAPVYTHLNYSPTSNHSYQLWVSTENNVTGWLISSGSGASALCTQELHAHSLVGTQWTS